MWGGEGRRTRMKYLKLKKKKIKTEISILKKHNRENLNESYFFETTNKIDKSLAKLIRGNTNQK
jgi:hypothetical protein